MKTPDALIDQLKSAGLLPVIVLPKPEDAVPLCRALSAGGVRAAEITFRAAGAAEAIRMVVNEFPEFLVGAGTILDERELEAAIHAGAKFAVSPGFDKHLVGYAQEHGIPFFPGVATPTEIIAAMARGCDVLKFFPAGTLGGPSALKSIAAPFTHRGIRFIPTGGVAADNLADYLQIPGVIAAGGSWVCEKALIEKGNWAEIEKRSKEASAVMDQL